MHPRRSLFFVAPATPAGSTAFSASPFTGRQAFLLKRTRPPDHAFHESRVSKHESRTLLPPDYESLPPDYVFLPPDYDFFRIFTVLLPHNSSEFPTIPRNSSDTHKPLSALRPHRQNGFSAFLHFTNHATWFFPVPTAAPRRATTSPTSGFFTNHESRLLRFSRCFPARCGAAWGGMGGHHPPHRQHGLSGFSRVTNHESRPLSPSVPPCPPPGHGFPVHDCSPLFTINLNGGGPEQVSAHRQPFSVGLPSRAVSPQLPPLSRLLGLWLPRMGPMPGKENALGCANRGTFSAALTAGLLFSPPGEAKCVRGLSGRGERRLARAGVLAKSPPSPLGSRNTTFTFHRPSDISFGANQAPANGFHESRDTKHESRPFIVCFDRRVVRNAGYALWS